MRPSREYAVQQLRVLGAKLALVLWLGVVYRFLWHSEVVSWAIVAAVLLCNAKFVQNFWIRHLERRAENAGGGNA